jgi:hypothetical protein
MGTKSKTKKEHANKVANRNQRIKEEKKRMDNMKRNFIMDLIKQEQDKGLFENNTPIDGPVLDGPVLDGPVLDGPILDGPILDLSSFDGILMDDITPSDEIIEEKSEESTTDSNSDDGSN